MSMKRSVHTESEMVKAVQELESGIDAETVAISARSAGEVNVQTLMEKMGGGGHFTGAALQRKESSVKELEDELLDCLDEYLKEEKRTYESNSIE